MEYFVINSSLFSIKKNLSIFEKHFIGGNANKGGTITVGKHKRIQWNTKKNIKWHQKNISKH
jgi:hypothetical protein